RRRHTRSKRDWSSDVCSSDLKASMYNKLQETQKFGLSILAEDQKEISMICAKQMKKDREISYSMLDDIPVISDSIATLSCHLKEIGRASCRERVYIWEGETRV